MEFNDSVASSSLGCLYVVMGGFMFLLCFTFSFLFFIFHFSSETSQDQNWGKDDPCLEGIDAKFLCDPLRSFGGGAIHHVHG